MIDFPIEIAANTDLANRSTKFEITKNGLAGFCAINQCEALCRNATTRQSAYSIQINPAIGINEFV